MAPSTDLPEICAHSGAILHFRSDPGAEGKPDTYEFFDDGMMIVDNGRVAQVGPAASIVAQFGSDMPVVDHGTDLLLPGFIDTHIHYPQTDVIGAGGRQLLDWLNDYTFPAEAKFGDPGHAESVAEFFLDELLRNGTTTALVFCTVHATSVEAFFAAASRRRLRMIAGKVLMDRHCPDELREQGIGTSRNLLERWHGKDRLSYAITPRFAPTSTNEQLNAAGALAREFPNAYIHSHLAENHAEIAWVKELFPEARSYLDVYARHDLVRERAVYAHGIYLDDDDRRVMAQRHASIAFCPASNLYLGSGLFDIAAADRAGLRFAMGTDVGGGTSFSQLRTLAESYKVAHMTGQHLSALRAFYLATLGGARVLDIADRVGSFAVGNEADFIAIDLQATPLLRRRIEGSRTLAEKLLVLMTLGDDRVIRTTYVAGQPAHQRDTVRSRIVTGSQVRSNRML
jgi:guanine deaminase